MKVLFLLFPLLLSASEEGFMTDYEYGEVLYNNPRGISCAICHGEFGEGKVIVKFKNEKGKQSIKGSEIRKMSLKEMITAVNAKHSVMPRYYLTDTEIKIMYDFLKKKNKE